MPSADAVRTPTPSVVPLAMPARPDEPPPDDVARRVARFERTRDPADLWPGLTERARVAAAREIGRVTRAVLAGESRVPLDPSGAHDAYALSIAGLTTGVGPLLGRWIEDGIVDAAPDAAAWLARHLAEGRRRAARIEAGLLPAVDALLDRGIVPVALKGLHTARAYFPEPGVRRMSDVDLLVSPERVGDAEAALRGADWRPLGAALRPYRRDWIGPEVDPRIFSVELSDARSRWTLELHASLDRRFHDGAVARLDPAAAYLEPWRLCGRPLGVLRSPLLLVALACHCSQELDASRLLRLVEIVLVARADGATGRLDWDALLALLRRNGLARYAHPAFALAEELAPGTIDGRVLAAGRRDSTWAARHTVARLAPAGGSLDQRGVLRQLMWTRGPVAVTQRLARTIWPASFVRPGDVVSGWRARLRRLRAGTLSLGAPDERVDGG